MARDRDGRTQRTGTPAEARGDDRPRSASSPLVKALGWFSVGLGAAQLLAPQRMERLIDLRPTPGTDALMRGIGLQEIAVGTGILRRRHPGGWLWSRVAGDATHLALLGNALRSPEDGRAGTARATAAVAGIAAVDVLAAVGTGRSGPRAVRSSTVTTVNRSPEDAYRLWRDLENLPRFMYHLVSVDPLDDRRSHWVAKGPARTTVEWDAEIVTDEPVRRIAWRSLPDAGVTNAGSVRFEPAPGGRGTEVTVELEYQVPGGRVGRAAAKMLGEHPEQQASDDLRRFKQVLETGEVVRSAGSPTGTRTGNQWKQDPAVAGR